jgi:hypothetical protein
MSHSVRPRKAFPTYSNKHSSLFQKVVTYGRKKYFNIDTRLFTEEIPIRAMSVPRSQSSKTEGKAAWQKVRGSNLYDAKHANVFI